MFGFVERVAMLALTAAGLWVVPRLSVAYMNGTPIWDQRRGMLEIGLGVVVSVLAGIGLRLV